MTKKREQEREASEHEYDPTQCKDARGIIKAVITERFLSCAVHGCRPPGEYRLVSAGIIAIAEECWKSVAVVCGQ